MEKQIEEWHKKGKPPAGQGTSGQAGQTADGNNAAPDAAAGMDKRLKSLKAMKAAADDPADIEHCRLQIEALQHELRSVGPIHQRLKAAQERHDAALSRYHRNVAAVE